MRKIGISDDKFIRGTAPMTKAEIRAITISKLELNNEHRIIDIGAGTGSITIECALNNRHGTVYAIERKQDAIELIKKNIEHFGITNIEIIEGLAPVDIPAISQVDRAIIGGSGGQLASIFNWLNCNLCKGGIVVANCITLENTVKMLENLKKHSYTNIETVQASIAKGKGVANLTMMLGYNPVYIISGMKEGVK